MFHCSDAVRMGWDLGKRNDFQLEVGFANLAWGVVAWTAAWLDWGTMVLASLILVFGIYMLQAAVLHMFQPRPWAKAQKATSQLTNLAFALFLIRFAVAVMS